MCTHKKAAKVYHNKNNVIHALKDINLTIKKGESVGLVGVNGSGKSTLLHILGGVDKPTSGHVYVEGSDVFSLNENNLAIFRRRQVGLIYQFYNLIPILNVTENISLPMMLDGKKKEKVRLFVC